jgi:hypothetical protein
MRGNPPDLATLPPECPFLPRCNEGDRGPAGHEPAPSLMPVDSPDHRVACFNPMADRRSGSNLGVSAAAVSAPALYAQLPTPGSLCGAPSAWRGASADELDHQQLERQFVREPSASSPRDRCLHRAERCLRRPAGRRTRLAHQLREREVPAAGRAARRRPARRAASSSSVARTSSRSCRATRIWMCTPSRSRPSASMRRSWRSAFAARPSTIASMSAKMLSSRAWG